MSLVKPLFVASIASLTLMMTSMSSTINLLQQMGILPTLGTCSNCSSQTGAYKSEGLYNYFRCSNCKKKQSLLQNTFLSNSNTTLHDYVLLMYQSSHLLYWDGMGWDKLAGTGVATAQKIVQRPTPFL